MEALNPEPITVGRACSAASRSHFRLAAEVILCLQFARDTFTPSVSLPTPSSIASNHAFSFLRLLLIYTNWRLPLGSKVRRGCTLEHPPTVHTVQGVKGELWDTTSEEPLVRFSLDYGK